MALPSVSMALLQGHLLRYKNDPMGAIHNIHTIIYERSDTPILTSNKNHTQNMGNNEIKTSKKRVLTTDQVDKMYFNPQEGWDKNIPNL